VNLLMLRTNASGNPSFRELLSRVRDETLAAFAHQELPYSKVVDEIGIKREKTSMPMIQIIFSYDEAAWNEIELGDLKFSGLGTERGTIDVDLHLFIAKTDQGLVTTLRYDAGRFKQATIARMLDHYEELLLGVIRNPDTHLFDIPLSDHMEGNRSLTQPAPVGDYANNT